MNGSFKRFVSALLALILLLSGLSLPEAQREAMAETHDEGAPIEEPPIHYTQPDAPAPQDVTALGEWQYWVEDGLAYVAGYANTDQETLVIPYSLGGCPVAGIGPKAFSANTALRTVRIHTNVTRIAPDAFEGLTDVTVTGYHGSTALSYAAENKLKHRDLSSFAVFTDGVIDLTGMNTKGFSDLTESSVTFIAREATFLKQGQILYFPANRKQQTGLARKVTGITPSGDSLRVTLAAVGFGEAFEQVKGEGALYLDWKHAVYPDWVSGVHDVSSQKILYDFYDGSISRQVYDKQLDLHVKVGDNWTIEGQAIVNVTAWASYEILRIGLFHWRLRECTVQAQVDVDINASLKFKGKTPLNSDKFYFNPTGKYNKTSEISIPFISMYGFTGYVTIELICTLNGKIQVQYKKSTLYTYTKRNGSWDNSKKTLYSTLSGTVEASIKFGPEVKVEIDLGIAGLADFTIFSFSVSVYVEGKGSLKSTKSSSIMPPVKEIQCLALELQLYFEVKVQVGIVAFKSKIGNMEFEIGACFTWPTGSKGKFPLLKNPWTKHFDKIIYDGDTQLFFEGWHETKACALTKRRVVFDPKNGKGVVEKIFDVNTRIEPPSDPTRSGYRFNGWMVDKEKSGLPGEDIHVNFMSMLMPYVDSNQLYLYADWYDINPVTSITLNKTSITGYSNVGDTDKLSVTRLLPTNANNKEIKWYSSNNNVATVDSRGNVKLKNAGTATITCQSVGNPKCKATCAVTVLQSVTGITLNPGSIFRYSDNMSPVQLTANVQPAGAVDKSVTWSSDNPSVATVSNTGYVTLKGLGTATITCRSNLTRSVVATCPVAVRQAVTGITLDRISHSRTNADMSPLRLYATVAPASAYNKNLHWTSSNTNVAVVGADGTVSMKGVGKATITCRSDSNPGITASFSLEITQAVTEIRLDQTAVTRYSDDRNVITLTPDVRPANAANKAVTFSSSDPNVVTVDQTGKVSVKAAGTAVVTCRSVSNPNVVGECRFTILQAVTGITLNKTTLNTSSDEINVTYLSATVAPSNAANKAITWSSSDPAVAHVTNDGVVTIRGVGQADIICRSVSSPAITAVCKVTVQQAVTGITLNETSIYRYTGQLGDVQLIAELTAADTANREVTWSSSDPSVASVSDSGIVSVKAVGTATITCQSVSNPAVTAKCLVTVRQSVTGITLNKTAFARMSDVTATTALKATIQPDDAANKKLLWTSSAPDVATVSDTGVVTIVGAGTAIITCRSESDPDVAATCRVTVRQAVTALSLDSQQITRYTNETGTITLHALVQPAYAYDTSVTWESSDTAVARVSDSGAVTVVGTGTAVITCRSVSNPALSAECEITVRQAVTSVSLDRTELTLFSNSEPVRLTATVLPADAENTDLVFTSSAPDVADVSADGLVTVTGTGTAVITVRALSNSDAFAECSVEVRQAVYSIILSDTELEVFSDETEPLRLTANVQPVYASDRSLTYTSSNKKVLTVSDSGVIDLKGVGSATITVRSASNPDVFAKCRVTVLVPMSGITLNRDSIELFTDDTEGVRLTAAIRPEDTTDTDVTWQTDNPNVAVVSEDGLVRAVGQGMATITVSSVRHPETVSASCQVRVLQKVEEIQLEGDALSLMPDEQLTLTAVCYPENADNKAVIWSSDNTAVASVSQSGVVTAEDYGVAQITAAAADGSGTTATYTVTVEHELALETVTDNLNVFANGNKPVVLASVSASSASVRRMAERGLDFSWTLVKPDENDDVYMDVIETTVTDRGEQYDTTYVVLRGSTFAAGSRRYTVRCTSGSLSATAAIDVQVDGTAVAQSVMLDPSTFDVPYGGTVLVPAAPLSADGNPLPEGIRLDTVAGDTAFKEHAVLTRTADGIRLSFDESGIYPATAYYMAVNLMYEVPVTFFVKDENGVVRIKTDGVRLSESSLSLVEGDTFALAAAVSPGDAYDKAVIWESSDETVATVTAEGVVTAVAPGRAAITATARDGSGAADICSVNVERFLQLNAEEVTYTVYTGGQERFDLGTVSVTIDSEKRLVQAGINVTWSLTRLSGSATEIGLEEFRAEAEEGITVSGNTVKLLRIAHAGDDAYRLVCRAGDLTASCDVKVHVVEKAMPETVSLHQTEYRGKVGEIITVDLTPSPALPEDTTVTIDGGRAFRNALSEDYDFTRHEELIFAAAGTYTAQVVFAGGNYSYTCPVTITVSDESGKLPVNITGVSISPDNQYMLVGDQATLTAVVEPAQAVHGTVTWSSTDTTVVTVSKTGRITAVGAGSAFVTAAVPESDFTGGCYVVVEDGLTLAQEEIERTVFVDGITRTVLDRVQLTPASSARLTAAPEWRLSRVEGNNLTLRTREYNTTDEDGNTIYGCAIVLYSMSRQGDCEYELSCISGSETVTVPVTVHAVDRVSGLPTGLNLRQTVFSAAVNELITVVPELICLPAGTAMPDGMRVTLEGDSVFNSLVNTDDLCVSQHMTTLSFSQAGLYEANYIYSYANMRYVVPVTFRIRDDSGNVPILASAVALSSRSLWLVPGETAALSAVFTPADTSDQSVTFRSTDQTVASVDGQGVIKALSKGETYIVMTPGDTRLPAQTCRVTVEDSLSFEASADTVSLYLKGSPVNELFSAALSQGTVNRLAAAGTRPEWTLTRLSGSASEAVIASADGADTLIVKSTALKKAGTDRYRVILKAGDETRSADFALNVIDLGNIAEYITPKQTKVTASVGQTVTVDFTPVCHPAGSVMPESSDMWSMYAGLGDACAEALDPGTYEENGDRVTLRFVRAGRYLMTRQFFLNNLHYSQVAEIVVGSPDGGYGLISADQLETTVYMGGTAGSIVDVTLNDTLVKDVYGDDISWSLSRVSGKSMTAALRHTASGVEVYTLETLKQGEDVWRVTCGFGGRQESVDIRVSVLAPRAPVPQSVTLSVDRMSGMTGDWLSMPIAVDCQPQGSALPETGDDFWTYEPLGMAADVIDWRIQDGMLRARYLWPGYYAGILHYRAGSFSYDLPVYAAVTDEEGVLNAPELEVYLPGMTDTVYLDGETNLVIGTALLSRGTNRYYAGESAAYLDEKDAQWSVSVTSGSAAALSIRKRDANTADIVLDSIRKTGTISYSVTCTADGRTYRKTGSLRVAAASERQPDPTLSYGTVYGKAGEQLHIPTTVYDRASGSILQAHAAWSPEGILTAIGHMYEDTGDGIDVTFYQDGTYRVDVLVTVGNTVHVIPIIIVIGDGIRPLNTMTVPKALSSIEAFAFEGSSAQAVDLRGSRITSIGEGAFRNCIDLEKIYIPATVTQIGADAFYGCLNVTFVCDRGSGADEYAAQYGITVQYND